MSNSFKQPNPRRALSKEDKLNRHRWHVKLRMVTKTKLAHQRWDEIIEPRKTQGWMTY